MQLFSQRFRSTTHRALAGFMAMWLSGVLFLICCANMGARAAEPEFCPLAKKSAHCDKAKSDDGVPSVTTPISETSMYCCGFLSAVFDKSRKVEQSQNMALLAEEPVEPRQIRAPALDHSPLLAAYHPRLPNFQKTFIQNCVFII